MSKKSRKLSVDDIPLEVLEDPLLFVPFVWPQIKLYPKQQEVLESVRYNVNTFVHAANEVGKDFTASLAVVWFFASRRPCRIVTTSASETQLKSVLWGEIRNRIKTAEYDFGWDVSTLRITRNLKEDPLSLVMGQVARDPDAFQGHHLDHDIPRILAVFDECSAIADEFFEAAESWFHRSLNIGNPMNVTNYFYKKCKAGDIDDPMETGLLNKIIHISGDDSPNVQAGKAYEKAGRLDLYEPVVPGVLCYKEYRRREIIWDKIQQHKRLKGLFYEGSDELMFPPDWFDMSHERFRELNHLGFDNDNPRTISSPFANLAMGVDCGAGRDLSVWTIIDRAGLVYQHAEPTPDTSKLLTKTMELIKRFGINPARVCFDAGGGGKQIVDLLRLKPGMKQVRSIAFGSTASPPPATKVKRKDEKVEVKEELWTYKNKRVEMHDKLRRWMDPSVNEYVFAIPEELYELRQDLALLPIWFDGDGKQFLPPKDPKPGRRENPDEKTLKKLLGRSPDRGDSLVLAVEALTTKPKTIVGAIR